MTTTATCRARLAEITLPDFGMPAIEPLLPASIYTDRLDRVRDRMAARDYDVMVIWADREHSANLAYLSGFDPRFEEAVMIVSASGDPTLLAGNECFGTAEAAPLSTRCVRFQDLSLPNQPRDASPPLADILGDAGISTGRRVGVVGWKTYASRRTIEAPAFLVDELRVATGPAGLVENATDVFIDAADGLRVVNEVEQLAAFEWAACQTSHGVRNLLTELRPGHDRAGSGAPARVERDPAVVPPHAHGRAPCPVRVAQPGRPADPAWRSADRGVRDLGCPQLPRRLRRRGRHRAPGGDRPTTSSGWSRRTSRRWPSGTARCTSARLAGPCTRSSTAISATRSSASSSTPVTSSTSTSGSAHPCSPARPIELRSGMALQCDIIPATGTPYFTTNIEDGLALADESLRAAFATGYPDAWARIQARRSFMEQALGIELHPDVLPFSNLAAHLPPFLLAPDRAMTIAA